MTERKELTCIGCPLGCQVTVELEGTNILSVTGHTCPRGEAYARKEVTSPARIVTSTLSVVGEGKSPVPCQTSRDIPKDKIFDIICALKEVKVVAPIQIGDVLVKDVAGTGADIIATANAYK